MSTTRQFRKPDTAVIGKTNKDGEVLLNEGYSGFLGGLEDVSGRVSAYVDPSTATVSTLIAALIAAKLMKAE
jgi:hypothetical protein